MTSIEGTRSDIPEINNLELSRGIVESKLANTEYVLLNIHDPDYTTPPNKWSPEGRSPLALKIRSGDRKTRISRAQNIGLIEVNLEDMRSEYSFKLHTIDIFLQSFQELFRIRDDIRLLTEVGVLHTPAHLMAIELSIRGLIRETPELYEGQVRSDYLAAKARQETTAISAPADEVKRSLPPSLDEITKLVKLQPQQARLYHTLWNAKQRGIVQLTGEQLAELVIEGEDSKKRRESLSTTITSLRKIIQPHNVGIMNIASSSRGVPAIYDLEFINPPALLEIQQEDTHEEVDTTAMVDALSPYYRSRTEALRRFIAPHEALPSIDEVRDILNTSGLGKGLKLPQNVWWALRNAAGAILKRVTDGTATEQEKTLWEDMKKRIEETNDSYTYTRYKGEFWTWYQDQRTDHSQENYELVDGVPFDEIVFPEANISPVSGSNELGLLIDQLENRARSGQIRESDITRMPNVSYRLINELKRQGLLPRKSGNNPVYTRAEVEIILSNS